MAGQRGVVCFFERSVPESHDGVTDVFVERAAAFEDDMSHVGKILIEEDSEFLSVKFFRNSGEAANVAEHYGDCGLTRFDEFGIKQQAANNFRAEVLAEGGAHAALFFFFDQDAEE